MKTKQNLIQTCLVVAVLLQVATSEAQNLTFTSTSYPVGSGPVVPAAADVNGDGRLDLIIPIAVFSCAEPQHNSSGNTLVVLTNNGSGAFGYNATLGVGTGPLEVAAADVNGDGHVDLISANITENSLTVLTNNGSGGFGLGATLSVGAGPSCVLAADLNGDGCLDLVSANSHNTSTLTVWFNNGSGGFVTNATLNVGFAPYCVAAADVNGDGFVDLISANFGGGGGNSLTVLTNNGSGGFGLNATLTVGNGPLWVVAADVNGDGFVDLISANFSGNSWTVLTNNGGGGFVSSATVNDPIGGFSPCSFTAQDYNGDGRLELICGTSGPGCSGGDNALIVLTNNGAGVYGYNTTLYAGNKINVLAADVNGDGKLNLITANYLDGTVTVMMNTSVFPAPTFTPKLAINLQREGMRVAWPSVSPGWSLQENPDLRTPTWLPGGYGGYGIADDGTNKSLTLPFTTGNLFFRLLHP